jgi:filamentous hemagglutinin family protein
VSALALTGLLISQTGLLQAQVVIDGTTATGVVVNADGSVTVGIAGANSDGISINRYNEFNVPTPGLELDNRVEGARTIVNEVTSTSTTKIEGTVEVLGQRAHTIIANPNGIMVDGGRFINTGHVALTTGKILSSSFQIAPNIFQQNVVSSVDGGTITVTGEGLSGQMDAVDLIAHSIKVDAPITVETDNPDTGIKLAGGSSRAEFNSAIIPGNAATGWSTITSKGETSQDAVLVEILAPSVLGANRIGIEVSDIGAGVRFAGRGYATARSFSISADGHVDVETAEIGGGEGIAISGGSIALDNSTLVSTDGSIQFDATGSFEATGTVANAFAHLLMTADEVKLEMGDRTTQMKAENGSLILTTRGDTSSGNVVNNGSLLQGGTETENLQNSAGTKSRGAVTLDIAGSLQNNTQNENLAIVFGAGGDVSIETERDVENNRGRILSNGDLRVVAENDVFNMVEAPDGEIDPEIIEYTEEGPPIWWTLFLKRERETYVSYDYGELSNPEYLATMTAAGNATVSAGSLLVNQGGEINANGGDLRLNAVRLDTIGLGSGQVFVRRNCILTCTYEGDGEVTYYGGRLNASGDVRIFAPDQFYNDAGAVFAGSDVLIRSDNIVLKSELVPTLVERPEGLYNFWASKAAWIYLRDQFGSIIADTGSIRVVSDKPVRVVGGSMTAARSIRLQNGEEIVRAPSAYSGALDHTIGFFADLPLIRQ